ncbi:LWXIA domain-containing protein [Burkholderia cenocepacia]|uniref:LWXIA domain-containing protein n=7 Tax=Burkholderia cenocepacia TaxID=95486 RepID=UPI00097BC9C0|nr:LWXIA domain-containing protein [Burkholderia cenocepacia]AQQ23344.1 peptidoglycan-binding protein [Burkholderia cenocepacia]ONJ10675.1 peptidoglycan-binding protein [Burkholderia cenocepacia]ONN79006.1 peptidoglycan-binding protein [Burkholderia cenocepacia]ONN87197.1 peptidoglycan-binding protein [Burkholderia cenocepacia]ONN90790.1 peptidoglycan-binding protein [Burkholderia cenocepacia]
MLSIDGMGLGLNWQRFLSQTLDPDLAPKPPRNTDGTSNDGPNNGPANPVNPTTVPPISVQADLGTDPSKPTNAEIASATALLRNMADQYRVAPPEITVDNDTTQAVQRVIQDAQTRYDDAQHTLQGAQGVLRMTNRDPEATPDERKAARDNYTKAHDAAATAQRELDVTTDAGYRILYGEQAKADQYSADPSNDKIEGPAQQQADAKLAALQKLFPDQTKANPNFIPQQGDCKTPAQVQAYDDWQSATSTAVTAQAKYWADVSNANLAYTQFQSYMADPSYKDAIDTGVGKLNDALEPLQLQVDLPDPPPADANGNVDMNAVQANIAQAAKIANYSNAAYAASLDAQQVTTLQQKYDADSACLIGSTPGATKDDKAALDRATTQANTSGSYMQMLGAQLTVDDLQTKYDTAKSASDDWHIANPRSLDPHPTVDADLAAASDALAQAKQKASLAHDGFVVAYGQTLAQQYDDAGAQIDAQLKPKVPFVLQNPTPTLSTNPPPSTTPPSPSAQPSPSLSTSLPSPSSTASSAAPSTTQTPTPSSSLSTSAPPAALSTSLPPTTLFTNPSFVLQPPGSNTSVPTTATGQTALDAKKLHVVAGALRAADGRLSNTFNDAAAKFQLANAKTQEGVLKGKLADMQKTYDDWYANHPTPVRMREVNGDEIPMPTPRRPNPYQDRLDEARNNLQQADATINKLQLLTEMSRQQVLLDQFDASLAENLRNPQSQDDKDAYSKALDGFFRAHQGELSQSLLDQAGASTNKAATIDFGKLTDNEQRNLIGTAIGLPPDVQPSADTGTPTAPVNDDSVRYTDNEKLDTINKVRGEILELGGGSGTQVNILPLIYSDKTAGMVTSALFKVTDSKGHVQYVDDTSANYDNIGDYLDNNQLASSGTLDLVTGYDDNGHAQFQQKSAHHDDWFDSALNTLTGGKVNLGMMGLGLLMEGAGVLLDATGVGVFAGGALNFAGGLMMDTAIGSSMTKSALDIGSRWEHNQSINPFTDAGARGDWLNLVPMGAAGAAKFAGSEVFARTVTALRSARAARISTAIVRGTSLATGLGAAGESFVEAAVDFAHGDREHGWDALKSGFTNVALMGAGGVRDRVVNATVRVTGRPVVARSAGGERISIDGQQLQKILSRNEPSQLAFGATRVSLDGVDIKVAKDGTLMAGDKVLTYDNMPVRVLDSLNNKDLNHLPRGTSVILGENGELSIVELTGKTWTEGTKIDSVTETGDRLSFGSDGEINAPSKLVAKTPVPSRNAPRQPASNDTPPADSAPRTTPANEAAARATAANDTATATTAASARNAQHTSEAQAARDENQQETRASDSHVAAQNRRSSDLRAAHDPAVARTPGAPGAGALEEPASVAPRTPVRVIDLTDAEPASRPATRDPAGVSVPRGPSVEALDHGEHTLLIVRNGEDPAAARPDAARPRAAGELPADVAEPIVVIADAADAHVAPELANRWQRPVFAAAPDALHADGTLRADAPLTRYLPAPDAAAAGGRVVGTNAQAAHADAAGVVEADAPAADPDAPAARRAPRPVNDDTVVVLASTRRNVADPDTHAAVPQPPARAARALDGAFSAPNRILVLVKPAERAPTQAANDAREAAAPKPARDARTQDHALPAAAHPDTTEAPADPSLAGPGLFTRLQMRFGGAPLPDAVHALAQQSGTLTQQLRMLSDAGWRVSLGKRGGGSRIDPKRRRVTIDGALHDSGSITYTLAHEAKHTVEAIDGTLDSLDYSGRSRFTRKALEAEARAQINAFEARYEIDLAGGGDIAANTTLPDALQHEADRWSPSSDYAGTVERLADAFADAPVSGRHGETYRAFYDGIWDKQKRHGGAPRRMPAPHTTEGTGGAHLPRTLEEQVRWSFSHAETISPFAERGRHEPRQMTLRMLDERTSSGTEEPVTIIRGRTDATGQLLDAHGSPAQHVPFSIAHFLAGTSTSAGTGRALVLAADDGHAAAAWLTNTWQRPVYVPDGGTIRAFDAAMRNPGSQRPEARFDHAPTWTRYAPSPRERIDYGELAVDAHGLYVAGDPSRRLDPQALIGPFLGAGIEKSVFELGKRNAIGLYDVDPSRPRDGQLANHYDALDTERTGLDLLRRYGMRTLTIDGPFSVGNRIGILYHPLAELSSRAISLGALPSRITHESMQQLAAMREIVERDGLVFDFQGVVDARGEFYFSDPATIFRTDDREEIDATLEEIDTVIAPLERGIRTGSIVLAHPAISESLPDGAFVQKPSRFTRIRMWFGGAPLPDAAYALAGRSSLLADQLRLLKSDGWQVVWGRAGRGSRTDVEQRRIVVDGGLRGTGTLVYTLAHEAGHAADVSNDRLGLDTSTPEAYVQSTLLAEARAQANAFAVRQQILESTGVDIAEHAVLPDAIAREADHVMPGDDAGLARLADAFGNAPVSGRDGEHYRAFYGSTWDRQQQPGNAALRMPAPHTAESSGGSGGARLPRTLDEQAQWSHAHADRASPFPRRWFGGGSPTLSFSRHGPVSYANGEPLTLVHARTDAAGGLLDARGNPATPVDYSIDHRHAFTPARAGAPIVLAGEGGAAHAAWLANLWQRTIYVPDSGTVRTLGEPRGEGTQRMRFGGPRAWTRYTPSPRERIDAGALAVDEHGLHVAGDPSRRVDPDALLGPFLGAGTAKAVFELGKRNAIGVFDASGDKARTMLAHEKRGLEQLTQLGMRTVTVDGPFTYHGRVAVLYSPLAELGSLDVMHGILPKRVTRESMRQLAAMRELAARHGLSFDFEGLFDANGEFHFSDPSVLIPHPDPATNRTPEMIDAVIQPLERGIASGHVELAHPLISESLPDGAFVQKPSRFTRIRTWFGGAPLPDAAYALADQSSLLAAQLRLLNPGRWEIVQGRAGAGSKVDAEQRRIVIDGGLRNAGTIVYVLAHEVGHAVDVATNRLDLDTSSPDAYAESALRAEARAQANAFAVRKQILESTGIDIAAHAVLPDAIAREADHVMPGDAAGLARLADAFGNVQTSLPGNPVYRALYRTQAEQARRDGEAGRAGAMPRTMPSMMMWPMDPSSFLPAAPVLAPEARAADWLDAHGKRDLKRIDGTQLADIRDLAQYAGPNAHVLIAKHADRPADDGTHPQPEFVASLTTDAHGQPGQVESIDPGGAPSHDLRDALYPGTRPRKRSGSATPHEARAQFDFYLSPVSLDELRQFGGAAKVEAVDSKRVWNAEPSGDAPAQEVVEQIGALAGAPQFKRPKAAAKVADDSTTIFAVDRKTGKVLGYAVPKQGGSGWAYHEKTSVGDASIAEQDLGAAFRRRARGLPDGRRGVVFVPSSLPESVVSRYGGFAPAERALPIAEQKPPSMKTSDRVQRRLGKLQSRGKPPAGATSLANPWVAPNLLPKSADDVHDFNGANTLHLRRVIDLGQVGPEYFIYVYGTEGALIDTLHQPDGLLATRDGTLQWFDDAAHFADERKPGVDLDRTKIGGGPDGSDRHFLVTRLDPAEFDARTKPTQVAAYALKQAELDKQLQKAAAESSAPFGELRRRIAAELAAAKHQQATLAGDPASGTASANPPAKPNKAARGKGKKGSRNAPAAPAPAASPAPHAAPAGKPFSIKTYQPGLTSATVAEWILRFGKAKLDDWFPEHERVKAFAGRTGEPLDLGATRQVMMADSVMMKALGIPLRLARDVSSMPWRGPLSRPDHAANLVSRHAKRAITYLSIARAADRHALQAYARAKAELQDRLALMARGFTLRDDPAEMLALVKRYGGAMPVVSVAVDPYSLAAALGRKHDPAFIRRVRELGKLDNAQFDEANARIDIVGTGRHLELDDLDHLFKWLDAASEGGFVLRLETAPSRALVSAEDQRTLAGTNDAYHDYVRTFDALETWARQHTGKTAPHVMVTFHGWDAVLEPAPGDGHLKLVEAVLDRKELDWVHLGLSYATHGADFVANQDLTAALARTLVDYKLHAPDKLARLHGADALTRVFERVGAQTLANQHQVLFAEVERVGVANKMTPDELAQLRADLYEGHTTALMDRARQATITYAQENYWNNTAPANRAELRARDAGKRWLNQYGRPATERKIGAHANPNASSTAFWRAVAADPKLAIDETKPVLVNRDIAAQPSHQLGNPQEAALAQLNALRVHRPSFGKRDWAWSLGFGGTVAGASSLVALNVFNGMTVMSSDALTHANTALFVGARAGRVFGAMHQGAVQSLQSGDPRAVHDVLDRLQRSLAQQLTAPVHGYNPARLQQLDLLTNETRVKATHLVDMHRQGLIGFDDAAAQIRELSVDLLANMQGMVGGTSLAQLHHGNSRRLLGLVGRGSAIVGYSGTIAVGVHGLMTTPTVAGALTTASAALAATYSGLVYAVSAHRVNADKRSRVVRLIDSTSDFVGVASGVAGSIAQYDKGHYGLAATAATSTLMLLGARLNTHFPNATRWVRKYPTALILVPIGIWGFTQLQNLFFGPPSGGSGSSPHKPQSTPASPSHQPPQPTGGAPTAGLAPGTTATQPPGTGTTGTTAPAQPAAPPSSAAQPTIVVAGDSLWVIADAHRQSLLDAAHVSQHDRNAMTRDQQDARALNEILQLNPGLASAPNVLHVGQSINVG